MAAEPVWDSSPCGRKFRGIYAGNGGLEKMMELKKRRNAYLMFLLLCLVAAAAIAGMSALLYQSSTSEREIAEESENPGEEDGTETGDREEMAEGDGTGGLSLANGTDGTDGMSGGNGDDMAAENTKQEAAGSATADTGEDGSNDGEDAGAEGAGGGNASNMAAGSDLNGGEESLAVSGQITESILAAKIAMYSFDNDKITWPVEGEVCLEYNMEHTIYFSTLDLYRCNPGVCISAEEGTVVFAGADGVVTAVTEDSFYGTMITIALGSDFEATYGQLADVSVSVGDEVSASTQIAVVAEPTIYFTEEGAHLFFKVTKGGETQDPLDYLNY